MYRSCKHHDMLQSPFPQSTGFVSKTTSGPTSVPFDSISLLAIRKKYGVPGFKSITSTVPRTIVNSFANGQASCLSLHCNFRTLPSPHTHFTFTLIVVSVQETNSGCGMDMIFNFQRLSLRRQNG